MSQILSFYHLFVSRTIYWKQNKVIIFIINRTNTSTSYFFFFEKRNLNLSNMYNLALQKSLNARPILRTVFLSKQLWLPTTSSPKHQKIKVPLIVLTNIYFITSSLPYHTPKSPYTTHSHNGRPWKNTNNTTMLSHSTSSFTLPCRRHRCQGAGHHSLRRLLR